MWHGAQSWDVGRDSVMSLPDGWLRWGVSETVKQTVFKRCAAAFLLAAHYNRSLCWSDTTGLEEQERERRRQVMEKFQKAPFEEIAAHCESKVQREPMGSGGGRFSRL